MNILRKNTIPAFQFIPRLDVDIRRALKLILKNEDTQAVQEIICSALILENENYQLILEEFPAGNIHEKFSYTLVDYLTNDLLSLGKILIVDENENVQDYTTIETNNFYS